MSESTKTKVLLVDDSKFNLKLFARYLSDQGYELETSSDGQAAWDLLKENPSAYSTVLLDMVMPGMDGIQVIKEMRKNAKLKGIPVIFQTANEEELHKGIQAGADYYIKKPFKAEQLQTTFKAAVKKFQQFQELNKELQKGSDGLDLLVLGKFQFRTLEHADALAAVIAQACPNPDKVIMGLSELLINAVEHGNLGITYDEKSELTMKGDWKSEVRKRMETDKYKDKIAKVTLERSPEKLSITIEDEGNGFDWQKYMDFDPARAFDAHGRGIATANQICFDSLEYKGKGNIVTVTVNITG